MDALGALPMPSSGPRLLAIALVLAVGLAAGAVPARGEDDAAPRKTKYAALEHEVLRAFAEKRWSDAEARTREQIALLPLDVNAHYNLACSLARQGKTADALANLRHAVELGFDDPGHLGVDKDLDSLRGEKGFEEAVAVARAAQERKFADLYEPPQEVKGVKSVEGNPAGGLRWRLRIAPDASAKEPQRLVVWLHPSGGSMNTKVEPLAVDLAKKGWALLVTTSKRWESWTESDGAMLLEKTLPDVAKVEGVDASRPVLLGFSAGGQMALLLWAKDPARFGGLVLDAAYPLDEKAYAEGRVAARSLPSGEAVKKTPIFVLVGDADDGHKLWKAVEAPWRAAGVPLLVTYVPGGEHQWLFGDEEGAALLSWLSDISAGKCPGAEATAPAPAMADPEK